MSDFDKTRSNIGVKQLNEKEKKEMFNRFVDAGGQVVAEKKTTVIKNYDRTKQQQYAKQISTAREKTGSAGTAKKTVPAQTARPAAQKSAQGQNPLVLLIDRISIKVHLVMYGVSDFSGKSLSRSFIELLGTEFKSAFTEIQILYLDLLKQNPEINTRIVEQLDEMKPLYIELIEMSYAAADVYERILMQQVVTPAGAQSYTAFKTADARAAVLALFKKLAVLYPYFDATYSSFEKAIDAQMRFEGKKSGLYSAKKKRIKNSLFVIYAKLYPKLLWLVYSYFGRTITPATKDFEAALSIMPQDKPGNRTAASGPVDLEFAPREEEPLQDTEAEEAEPEKKLPEEVLKGLEMMSRTDFRNFRQERAKDSLLHLDTITDADRVFITYMLFSEFDKEYSVVLTTNKIKLNVIYHQAGTGKADYRTTMSDVYDAMRLCDDAFKEYSNIVDVYEKARREKPTTNDQYIRYTKLMTELLQKRKTESKKVRDVVSTFFRRVSETLIVLIKDMNSQQMVVANPQDILTLEGTTEKARKLNGKKVYEAIAYAYCFASAFVYRLSLDGDLSGGVFTDEDDQGKKIAAQTAVNPLNAASVAAAKNQPASSSAEKPSQDELKDNL